MVSHFPPYLGFFASAKNAIIIERLAMSNSTIVYSDGKLGKPKNGSRDGPMGVYYIQISRLICIIQIRVTVIRLTHDAAL